MTSRTNPRRRKAPPSLSKTRSARAVSRVVSTLAAETMAALSPAETALCRRLDQPCADRRVWRLNQARRRQIIRRAVCQLPTPESIEQAVEIERALAAAVVAGVEDHVADVLCERRWLLEREIILSWPALSIAEIICRLEWARVESQDSELDRSQVDRLVRRTLDDLRRLGSRR